MTWKHMCCVVKSSPVSQNRQMFLICSSTALLCSTDLQKHLFIHFKCHDMESGWFIWCVPWWKKQKIHTKLETNGRITAFLGALDTQEKANSAQAPGLIGWTLRRQHCDPHQRTELQHTRAPGSYKGRQVFCTQVLLPAKIIWQVINHSPDLVWQLHILQ